MSEALDELLAEGMADLDIMSEGWEYNLAEDGTFTMYLFNRSVCTISDVKYEQVNDLFWELIETYWKDHKGE